MKILEKYTGDKTYMYPNGHIATPERVLEDFPAGLMFTHVLETDEAGEVLFSFENLSALRTFHNLDSTLSEDEAITVIQGILNAPPPEAEPSSEERIAAALELQNLMMMEDIVI